MNIRIIIPYFGKLPNYFQLWLNSCAYNKAFNWLLLTDDKTEFIYPDNVEVKYTSFQNIVSMVQSKFDFEIALSKPSKICAFRPAYGQVFSEYLKGFDYWGTGDVDLIYGDLSKFITEEALQYDKIFALGHLCLYKNTKLVNERYKLAINGRQTYKTVFTNSADIGLEFDEWSNNTDTIVDIYIANNIPFYVSPICADIHTWYNNFRLVEFWYGKMHTNPITEQVFTWDKGILNRVYIDNNKIKTQEYGYIHFQKRKMDVCLNNVTADKFLIVPNKFTVLPQDLDFEIIKSLNKSSMIDKQYLKIRSRNLKTKIIHKLKKG